MNIPNENLFLHSLAQGMNLFLGAGFSVAASSLTSNNQEKTLPIGDGLKDELLSHFKRPSPSKLNLAQLCQILGSTQRNELVSYFEKRFNVTKFDPLYKNLERMNIKSIFTTNIDNLIFKLFEESNKYFVNDIILRGPSLAGASAIDYIALHGCITHGDGAYDFSPIEIASSFDRDKDKWFGYIGRIKTAPTLYWGYRLEDASVLQALAKNTNNDRVRADSWIVLRNNEPETVEYYESLGFQIIIGDTIELLKYFGQLSVPKVAGASKSLISKNFREYFLPTQASLPVRSLTEFYLGAEPTWFDIYSKKIYHTRYFAMSKDILFGTRNLMLIGAAVTGKSTLLKQLAHWFTDHGPVLFIEEITPEKAALLVRDIDAEGKEIFVFVDNAADASEGIQIMMRSPNISLACAERDYIYDSVSYRFPGSKFEVLDVSGLSDLDSQAVQRLIPHDIQRKQFEPSADQLEGVSQPTFFEVITSTITADSLVQRFMAAIRGFKKSKPTEHDLLLMACYLYTCRIPTSIDVATAFSRRFSVGAEKVLEVMESIGNLLSPYEGTLADSSQSFYVPRSRAVAEEVIWKIDSEDLRHMLEVFHEEVSPTKIGRYDIFRRNAYDAKIVGRAFPNWEDGLEFYLKVEHRDSTHSLKQQGALYLSNKKQFDLAFSWIDDALAMTGKFNPSVRNTYAVILFSANIDKPSSTDVIATLDESMQILQRCHKDDHRKIYHAKIYAEQALRYQRKLPTSSNAAAYLEQSDVWLASELKARPADRRMLQLAKNVKAVRRMR